MAPRPRRPRTNDPTALRRAAALLLVYPIDGVPHVLLTVRAGTLAQHGGQVSLPGGAVEPAETIEEAALRETLEECGIGPESIQVLGAMTPIQIPVSRFLLHPIAGVSSARPALRLDAGEVARVLEAPLGTLADPATLGRQRQRRDGLDVNAPYFAVSGIRVWGATAMVLAELLYLLGHAPDPWLESGAAADSERRD